MLQRTGIPTRQYLVATRPAQLAETLHSSSLILKPHRGCYGKGIRVVERATDLPASTVYLDLVFGQEYLAHARTDLKVFVIGERAFGVRKAFGHESYLTAGVPATLSPQLKISWIDAAEHLAPSYLASRSPRMPKASRSSTSTIFPGIEAFLTQPSTSASTY